MGQKKILQAFDAYVVANELKALANLAEKHQKELYDNLTDKQKQGWEQLWENEFKPPNPGEPLEIFDEDEVAPKEACGISFSGCNEVRPCVLKKGHTEPHRNIDGDESEVCEICKKPFNTNKGHCPYNPLICSTCCHTKHVDMG
jgi:hypothetical protein